MLLRCPHCHRTGEHVRSDFFGDWVVCSVCELPFSWRHTHVDGEAEDASGDGQQAAQRAESRNRNER
jgi:hypothetical protein